MKTEKTKYPAIHTERFQVEWSEACASGKLSLTGLFNMVQLTAAAHADICRFGFREMSAAGQAWVLNRMKVRFSRMPEGGQEVAATTWIHSSNGLISERNLLMENGGQAFAQVSTVWVCINLQNRTPQHIAITHPDYLVLSEKSLDISTAARIRIPERTDILRPYRVAFSDIDALGHVNNVKYTQWILDSIPYETAAGLASGEIEVNFVAELHHGDEVTIEQGDSPQGTTFVIRRRSDGRPAFLSRYAPL